MVMFNNKNWTQALSDCRTSYIYAIIWLPCPKCGTFGPENSVCTICGTWIGERYKTPKYCPCCGQEISESKN